MRKYVFLALIAVVCSGCTASCQNRLSHMKSGVFGLNRKIILYSANGDVIREWKTTAQVEDNGGTCRFFDDKGKAVTISGSFLIEEL